MKLNPTKQISLLIMLLLLAVAFVACGKEESAASTTQEPSSQPTAAAAADQPRKATLRFSWWGSESRHQALLEAIDLYTSQNPGITIEPEYSGFDGYYQKLVTQFAGGTAPDLTPLSVDWINDIAIKGNLVLDLYDQQENLNLEAFNQEFLTKYTVFDDKLVGLPMGVNGMVIAYNKAFFQRFDIPEDTVWDWETIHAVGKKVHEQDPEAYLLAQLDVRGFLQPYVRQLTDEQWITDDLSIGFDQEVLTGAFAYYRALLDDGVLQPVAESSLYPDIAQNVRWQQGNVGMVFGLASTLSKLKSVIPDIDVTTYPIPADAKTSAVLVNPSNPLAINKASAYPEEAARFANWLLTDPEAARILKDVYSVPPVEANSKLLADEGLIDSTVVKAVNLALANPGDPVNAISGDQQLNQLATDYLEQVGFGKTDPAKAAEELVRRTEDKLKELK